jgi:Uma2 family endonuclease
MITLDEIKHALKRLDANDREEIAAWLGKLTDGRYVSFGVEEPQPAYAPLNTYFMTFEEFLEFAEHSPLRYEYVNGVIHAMTGASLAHGRISRELLVAVDSHLRGGPCEAFAASANLYIRSQTDEILYIPDLVVACNPEEWDKNWLCNPKLVAEILSPSTRHIDQREKAMTYRRVNSIEEYVLLEQSEHKVTVHRRAEDWRPQVYSGPQSVAEFRSISLSVPLAQIYAGTLPAA